MIAKLGTGTRCPSTPSSPILHLGSVGQGPPRSRYHRTTEDAKVSHHMASFGRSLPDTGLGALRQCPAWAQGRQKCMVSGENRPMGDEDAECDGCITTGISPLQSLHIFPLLVGVLSFSLFKLLIHKTHPESLPDSISTLRFRWSASGVPKSPEQNSALPQITPCANESQTGLSRSLDYKLPEDRAHICVHSV